MVDTEAFLEIVDELKRARSKFPRNRGLFEALVEEVGELATAVLKSKGFVEDGDSIRTESKHVACVAIRIMSEGLDED